jgi:hypothetical protein
LLIPNVTDVTIDYHGMIERYLMLGGKMNIFEKVLFVLNEERFGIEQID